MNVFLPLALAFFQAAAPAPVPIHDEPLTKPVVVYPADAKKARIEGTVTLQINVSPTGQVTSVEALSGPIALRQAAIDAYAHESYPPLITNGKPTPAIITTAVAFKLNELPPDTDQQLDRAFAPLHTNCQVLSSRKDPTAPDVCRQALDMANRFSPNFERDVHATAYNDLVLALSSVKRNKEATDLANQSIDLFVDSDPVHTVHSSAAATATITRAEIRYLTDNYRGAESDCVAAEEIIRTLLHDELQSEAEVDRSANYRQQLRETMLLHAVALEHQGKKSEANKLREQAKYI